MLEMCVCVFFLSPCKDERIGSNALKVCMNLLKYVWHLQCCFTFGVFICLNFEWLAFTSFSSWYNALSQNSPTSTQACSQNKLNQDDYLSTSINGANDMENI